MGLILTPYPHWLRMPDPITEHCKCCSDSGPTHGLHLHDRSWTLRQLYAAWMKGWEGNQGERRGQNR